MILEMVHLPVFSRTRYMQYAATLSATLSMTSCAMYTAWASPTLPQLESINSPIGTTLTPTEASWVASAFFLGYLPGGIISWYITSRTGPKVTLLVSAIPICLPWLAIMFGNSAMILCVARLIAGIGGTIATTAVLIYNAEISDTDIRGKLGITTSLLYIFGSLFVLSVGPFVSYTTLAIICSTFPVLFVATFWFMPESPYYLVKTNQTDAAHANIIRLCATSTDKKLVQVKLEEVTRTIENDMKNRATLWELFSKSEYRRPLIIVTGIKAIQQFCGAPAIEVYMQMIIESSKSSISPQHSSIIFGVIQLIAALVAASLVDLLGRKPLLIISSLGCAIALSFEGVYFYLFKHADSSTIESLSWLPTTGLVLFLVMYIIGLGTLPNVLEGELFPTNIKGHAVSFFRILAGVLSVFVILFFEPISTALGVYIMFFIFTAFCVVGAAFIYIILPETKGKTFAEIQTNFNKNNPPV